MTGFQSKRAMTQSRFTTEFEVWEGDLYLYSVWTEEEADEATETGFRVVEVPQGEFNPFNTANS